LASHPELGAGLLPLSSGWIFELVPILIAAATLVAAIGFRGVRKAGALSGPRKIFARLDWRRLVKDETVFALILVVTLGAAGAHFLFKHPGFWAGLATLVRFWISEWWLIAIGVGILLAAALMSVSPTLFGHPGRILGASAFLAAALIFLLMQPSLYAGTGALEAVWRTLLTSFADYTMGGALFVSAMLVLAAWYACGPVAASGRNNLSETPPDRLLLALT